MLLGSVSMATSFILPLQAGHSTTSSANVRRRSSARVVDPPVAAPLASGSRLVVRLRGLLRLRPDQRRYVYHLLEDCPTIAAGQRLAQKFTQLVRARDAGA
ncbi:hypothetical protein [Sorangium sp. So ce124]|uniref:hypothetical protein n=1 Tax=Sorangium sp. So ce124 TaxID=3133280 RepID=UPI003F60DADF